MLSSHLTLATPAGRTIRVTVSPGKRLAPLHHSSGRRCGPAHRAPLPHRSNGNSSEKRLAAAGNGGAMQMSPAGASSRPPQVAKHFPNCLGLDDFAARVEAALHPFGFDGDNTISFLNLCRDEATMTVKHKLDALYGPSFNINGLGGVLTCGTIGLKAGISHAPIPADGKERYVFFSFPHIAIDETGAVGRCSREGRPGASSACGALIAALGDVQGNGLAASCSGTGVHDASNPEYTILKQRLTGRMRAEGVSEDDIKQMDLVDMTKVAERAITDDLETLIKDAVDANKADYAVITGVQIHNWGARFEDGPNLELIAPSSMYVVRDGKRTNIDISNVRVGKQVSPRTPALAASGSAAKGLDQAGRDAQGAADHSAGQDVQGDMVAPSPANKQPVRVLAMAAALAIAVRGCGYLPARAAAFAHLLSWAILVGTNLWTTFVAGATMFKNLPRQVFGKLQSQLFPQYFLLQTAGSAIALATMYYSGAGVLQRQLYALGVALAASLANWLAVEPYTTGIMLERYQLENAQQRNNDAINKLYKAFSTWHGISSVLNLVVLVAAVTHGWTIATSVLSVSV